MGRVALKSGTRRSVSRSSSRKSSISDPMACPVDAGPQFRDATFRSMPLSRSKILLATGTVLLLAAFTADYWVRSLAGAVIDQAVIPLARLIVAVFT